MKSEASDVAEYLEQVPAERRPVLKKLRGLCRKVLANYQESMQYGMPVYKRGEAAEVAFASQKNYIAIYFMKSRVLGEHKALLRGVDMGKSCLRFPKAEGIDLELIEKLLRSTAVSEEQPR